MGEWTRRAVLQSGPLLVTAAQMPSKKLTMAIIGCGPRGLHVLGHFMKEPDVRFVAACDLFATRRTQGRDAINAAYGNSECKTYRLHEELLARPDIDAVLIATGDRWHSVLSSLAMRAGKDVYCEKPFCLTIAEGRALADSVRRYGKVWQCGTQRRSIPGYRFVADVVRGGQIGTLHTITMSFGEGWRRHAIPVVEPEPDPEVFDYRRWLGQAPWAPYSKQRVEMWRMHWDTSGGVIADMGPHYCDIAQWVHGSELSGPVSYEGEAQYIRGGFSTTPYFVNVTARYRDGVRVMMDTFDKAVRFDGEKGFIKLYDDGRLEAWPAALLKGSDPNQGDYKILRPHLRNFIESVQARQQPVSGVEVSLRSHTMVHCANICLRLGRKVRWEPETERFTGDEEANRMLSRTMREPWRVL